MFQGTGKVFGENFGKCNLNCLPAPGVLSVPGSKYLRLCLCMYEGEKLTIKWLYFYLNNSMLRDFLKMSFIFLISSALHFSKCPQIPVGPRLSSAWRTCSNIFWDEGLLLTKPCRSHVSERLISPLLWCLLWLRVQLEAVESLSMWKGPTVFWILASPEIPALRLPSSLCLSSTTTVSISLCHWSQEVCWR